MPPADDRPYIHTNQSIKSSGNHPRSNWPLTTHRPGTESWRLGHTTRYSIRANISIQNSVIRGYRYSGHPVRTDTRSLGTTDSRDLLPEKAENDTRPWLW